MKFTRDKYHLSIAYLGLIILVIVLFIQIYYGIKIYNWVSVFCISCFILIFYFKDICAQIKEDIREEKKVITTK